MLRRRFLKGLPLVATGSLIQNSTIAFASESHPANKFQKNIDREYWVSTLTRVTAPVLKALAAEKLKKEMPIEAQKNNQDQRRLVSHLEAFGRSVSGLAPWLELPADETQEGRKRKQFLDLVITSMNNAVNPASPDFLNFTNGGQPLVDAAFLAHGLLRAQKQVWANLDKLTQQRVVTALKSTRHIKPYESNWLLFPAMIEAALLKLTGECDMQRIEYATAKHDEWYLGDSIYGDGPQFHYDYYNSYVIQPMLLDVLKTVYETTDQRKEALESVRKRAQRYAEIQERLIAPDGSFPPTGRSLAYRCGAFQLLSQAALQRNLPGPLKPQQVRCALTAVIKRTLDAPKTFDENGWLTIGLCGHQPEIGEHYISTGSLYLCTAAFLPLGLPAGDDFWTAPAVDWTSKKVFNGEPIPIDHAYDHS
jgi:hypothetical protein